jgi:hypothetical protein
VGTGCSRNIVGGCELESCSSVHNNKYNIHALIHGVNSSDFHRQPCSRSVRMYRKCIFYRRCHSHWCITNSDTACLALLCLRINNALHCSPTGAGIAQSVYRLATCWTVRGSNHGEGEIFRICPDRPWGIHPLIQFVRGLFPEGKATGACR